MNKYSENLEDEIWIDDPNKMSSDGDKIKTWSETSQNKDDTTDGHMDTRSFKDTS